MFEINIIKKMEFLIGFYMIFTIYKNSNFIVELKNVFHFKFPQRTRHDHYSWGMRP